jgi:hypothetical protein
VVSDVIIGFSQGPAMPSGPPFAPPAKKRQEKVNDRPLRA